MNMNGTNQGSKRNTPPLAVGWQAMGILLACFTLMAFFIAVTVLKQYESLPVDASTTQVSTDNTELNGTLSQMNQKLRELETKQADTATELEASKASKIQAAEAFDERADFFKAVSEAFINQGINVEVNEIEGSIRVSEGILFAYNDTVISKDGKSFFNSFIPTYLDTLFNSPMKDSIGRIVIEGHSDAQGGYLLNLKLSTQRAEAVAQYVMDSIQLPNDQKEWFTQKLSVVGSANTLPVLVNGVVDPVKSRRVEFHIRFDDSAWRNKMEDSLKGGKSP